jgi:hypothetical protein
MDLHFATSQSGNPRKPDNKSCTVCGGTIQWRRRLARNWHEVMYCSASCRRASAANARTGSTESVEGYDHIAVDSVATAA